MQNRGFYSPTQLISALASAAIQKARKMEVRAQYNQKVREETLLKYDEGWLVPTGDEMRQVKTMSGKTGAELAKMVGVDGRTIRKWIGNETKIPYSAWRILVYSVRLIPDVV